MDCKLYSFYVHGYWFPKLKEMRDSNLLSEGKSITYAIVKQIAM